MSRISTREFADALRDYLGDRVIFLPGWQNATTAGGFDAHGVLHHWTAMGKGWHPDDQNQVLRHGYSGLPGPLCHAAPARDGKVYVIGWGNTNHAGRGDSRVYAEILAGRFDGSIRPTNENVDGNEVLYGLEYHYHPADGPMPNVQFEAGVLAAAAICDAHGWSPESAAGSNLDHFEWAGRKTDRDRDNLPNLTRRYVKAAMRGEFQTFGDTDMSDLDKPLNVHDPKGNARTANLTLREAISGLVIDVRDGREAAQEYYDRAAESPVE